MKKFIVAIVIIVALFVIVFSAKSKSDGVVPSTWWRFQSIDTMKYSRDLSRQELSDPAFDETIDKQISAIAQTGATHVAIATPYDEEFYPILKRWVDAARKYNLNVWFRGNWSGWEGWFEYPKITRAEHINKTREFILSHSSLFADGDVFTACPECENGGPGDPRQTGDVEGFRKFLIDEYMVTKAAFRSINKNVASNFDSMNGDVARAVMNRETTFALDGVVTIDHYVSTPEKLVTDIKAISQESGGKIVLGEFGAPIPDINGEMTEDQQAIWIKDALNSLVTEDAVIGVNYWTNIGSSTSIWNDSGDPKKAVGVLRSVYDAPIVSGQITDAIGSGVEGAYVAVGNRHFLTDNKGNFAFPYFSGYKTAKIENTGYLSETIEIKPGTQSVVVLKRENEDLVFKIRKFFYNLFKSSRTSK